MNRAVRRWALERTCGIVVRDPVADPDAPDPPATYAFTGPCDAAVSVDDDGVAHLLRGGEGWIQLGGRRAPRIDD